MNSCFVRGDDWIDALVRFDLQTDLMGLEFSCAVCGKLAVTRGTCSPGPDYPDRNGGICYALCRACCPVGSKFPSDHVIDVIDERIRIERWWETPIENSDGGDA